MITEINEKCEPCETKLFWGEIAPSENKQHPDDDDTAFLDLLEGYITGGFKAGDCVVILITEAHRVKLYERLHYHRVRLNEMLVNNQFIAVDAEDTLEKFMLKGHPDEARFMDVVNKLIIKAHQSGRPVRAFGEMIAHLWEKGFTDATLELEQLWLKFCQQESLTLMRAYPGQGLTEETARPMMYVYGTHRKMIATNHYLQPEILPDTTYLKAAV